MIVIKMEKIGLGRGNGQPRRNPQDFPHYPETQRELDVKKQILDALQGQFLTGTVYPY